MSEANKKIAVVLFNLGGPDSTDAIKPFLFNLFNDKHIIRLPSVLRFVVAWLVSSLRKNTAKQIYAHIGNKSPLLGETEAQREALNQRIGELQKESKNHNNIKTFICMRHWHPMAKEVLGQVKEFMPDEIIFLPLYPQFSTTTSLSSFRDFAKRFSKSIKSPKDPLFGAEIPFKTICCYPTEEKFIEAHAELILKKIVRKKNYRILFSAHGLPEKIVKDGDPYQWQVEQTVRSLVRRLNIDELDYLICYQSRVGPVKWIGPDTEKEVERACKENKNIIIVPIAFVSEHVETLVELDIEYKDIADEHGISYSRVATLSTNSHYIDSLAGMVMNFAKARGDKNQGNIVCSDKMKRLCPNKYSKCPCKITAL